MFFRDAKSDPQHLDRRWFSEVLTEARIKDCSRHCNRHTFASRLVMAGIDIRSVAKLMGYSNIQMTMRYAHLAPQRDMAAVSRLVTNSVTIQPAGRVTKRATGSITAAENDSRILRKYRIINAL
jgi:integrase